MIETKITAYIFALFSAWLAASYGISIAFMPQSVESVFDYLVGPFGVLFGQLLSIYVLAKILKMIYTEKEKLQQKLLDDREQELDRLRKQIDSFISTVTDTKNNKLNM